MDTLLTPDVHFPDAHCTCFTGPVYDFQLREFTNGTLHVYRSCKCCGARARAPMNVQLSIYKNSYDTKGVNVSLGAVAERIRNGKRGLDEKTEMCHVLAQTDRDKYKPYKEANLPAVTFAGTFPRGKRKAKHLAKHSGFVVIDIDGLLPSQIPDLLAALAQMSQVVLAFVSPSGKGIKIVVSVDPLPANDAEHKAAWQACVDFFSALAEEYGFEIDPSGKDCSRLCYLAHDPLAIVNIEATPIGWDREAHLSAEAEREKRRVELESRDWGDSEIDPSALDAIHPDSLHYDDWLRILIGCKSAGLTWQEVDAWSRRGTKHQDDDVEKRWDSLRTGEVNWGTVVYFAQQNGYVLPQRSRRAPKLQRSDDAPSETTETLQENRVRRENATDTFLSDDTTLDEKLHILLIKDQTGTGKSQTTLFKARQHGKRTIGLYPHSELAAQAVDVARQAGFKNPFHLRGRGHNWDDSGIAEIPVAMRTADLFEKNNCIMVDQIKAYTDKRIAPRTYCEHQCPFRDGCPHLEQYKGIAERDFIASCTPNLLFDLNMRGYLQSLVTATEDPSDEELAMDAILGTTSEETTEFDFAALDDYSISSLYTDITFSQADFKAIKKAWSGTPTAKFAKLLLKAFDKKKPQKIVKALRKAFESTADHHESIAKSLTQHARLGKIEYAEVTQHSKESKRLLTEKVVRYTDGGKRFIPVDFDAYKELTEKEIPTIHPQHLQTEEVGQQVCIPHSPVQALQGGVDVKDLTPVWQRGATPIELLDIFLTSIGNDKNAPITRTFRAGDPPVAILTFTIPPQAPVGILQQITMISASTDPEDTKRAFDGQPVTFSEHTGGQLELANGVEVYQFQDARLTSASVFEYPKDTDGKRKLQDAPIGLKPTAEKRLRKLNDWAKTVEGVTAFISYKEFTEEPFGDVVNGFDIVTHFDKVAGLNFTDLKYLIVFGYPKVKHEGCMEEMRKQHASDSEPLPKADKDRRDEKGNPISEYMQLTEETTITENGITITERRYKDPRLEKVRHQLATEKLEQAIGRARFPVWTDTQTILFTNAPVSITTRAHLFSDAGFNLAETLSDLADAMARIKDAEESGDVKAVMETKGVSQRQAYQETQATRQKAKAERDARILELHNEGKSQRAIEKQMEVEGYEKASRKVISGVVQNCTGQLVYTNYDVQKCTTPSDVGVPCVEGNSAGKAENAPPVPEVSGPEAEIIAFDPETHHPVPITDYSKLTESQALAELAYCIETDNYTGAAYLRNLL